LGFYQFGESFVFGLLRFLSGARVLGRGLLLLLVCRDRDAVAYGRAVLVTLAFWNGSSRSSGRVYT